MSIFLRSPLKLVAVLFMLLAAPFAYASDDGVKRLAIQVSDNDPATFNKALGSCLAERGFSEVS